MPRTLSFFATSVRATVDEEVTTLSFEVEGEGDPSTYVVLMNEGSWAPRDDDSPSVRMWWGDGTSGADECVVKVAAAALDMLYRERAEFRLTLREPVASCMRGYTNVVVSLDSTDYYNDAEGVVVAVRALFGKFEGFT